MLFVFGGKFCEGVIKEEEFCNIYVCLIYGGYLVWSDYGLCFVMCGKGIMIRIWICINLLLSNGGNLCVGFVSEMVECDKGICFVKEL